MTTTEANTIFRNYLMLVETHNEQKHHIKAYFSNHGIRTMTTPIYVNGDFTADYTFLIFPNHITGEKMLWFGDKFLIERKSGAIDKGGGFAELRGNLTKGHKQFKAEFQRMKDVDNVILLLENTTCPKDIWKVKEQKIGNKQFVQTYNSFIRNRNEERKKPIKIEHCYSDKSGEKVMMLIYEYLATNF